MGKELMELYKKYKVNPFSSCLPLLIQFPVFIAIYRIFREDLNKHLDLVYSFLSRPEIINTSFLGLIDLSKPNVYLAVMAGAAQFWQAKMMMAKKNKKAVVVSGGKKEGMAEIMSKQMLYFMPAITIFIGVSLLLSAMVKPLKSIQLPDKPIKKPNPPSPIENPPPTSVATTDNPI
jgi:YidC/Oxa1 family membrane protein insertase